MQFISELIKDIISRKRLAIEDLYTIKESDIVKIMVEDYKSFDVFAKSKDIKRSDVMPADTYCVSIPEVKKRYVIPLYNNSGSPTRLNNVSEFCDNKLNDYLNFKDSKYAYIEGITNITND
jgi:hypothetical protein